MGRQRDDVVRMGLGEDAALGREAVEVRRRSLGVPIEADGIGPQRVDRDQDDVPDRRRLERKPRPTLPAPRGGRRRARPPAGPSQEFVSERSSRRPKGKGPGRNSRSGPGKLPRDLEVHRNAEPHDPGALHLDDLVEERSARPAIRRPVVPDRSRRWRTVFALAALKSSAAGMIVTPPMQNVFARRKSSS